MSLVFYLYEFWPVSLSILHIDIFTDFIQTYQNA